MRADPSLTIDGAAWLIGRAALLAISGQVGMTRAAEAYYGLADEVATADGGV